MLVEIVLTVGIFAVWGLFPVVWIIGLVSSIRHGQPNLDQPWQQRAHWRRGH